MLGSQDAAIVLFWSVFDQVSQQEKISILDLVTASEFTPAEGFAVKPVRICRNPWNKKTRGPVPVARACFLELDLPNITDAVTI
jgi:hypothetical protein